MYFSKSPSDLDTLVVVSPALHEKKTIKGITDAIAEAERHSGVEIAVVNVGIAGQHIKSLQHRGILTRNSLHEEISQE